MKKLIIKILIIKLTSHGDEVSKPHMGKLMCNYSSDALFVTGRAD